MSCLILNLYYQEESLGFAFTLSDKAEMNISSGTTATRVVDALRSPPKCIYKDEKR